MKISPITYNFTKAGIKNTSFGKYTGPDASNMAKNMLEETEASSNDARDLWEILDSSEAVTISKSKNALWCEVNRPYFDMHKKRLQPKPGALTLYSDFIDFIENPSDPQEKKKYPVNIKSDGVYGPITEPQVLSRIAWTVCSLDPKYYPDPVETDEEEPQERSEPVKGSNTDLLYWFERLGN